MPMHLACRGAHVGVAKVIFEAAAQQRADLQEEDDLGRQPLHYACDDRDGLEAVRLELVIWLLEECGATADATDKEGLQPIHLACNTGLLHVALHLIEAGAKLDAIDKDLWQPIHFACLSGSLPVVKMLLDRGASPCIVEGSNRQPVHIANDNKFTLITEYPQCGANPNPGPVAPPPPPPPGPPWSRGGERARKSRPRPSWCGG